MKHHHKRRSKLVCPECGGEDIYYEAGMITGHKYHCKNCDYIGAFIVEEDIRPEKSRPDGYSENGESGEGA